MNEIIKDLNRDLSFITKTKLFFTNNFNTKTMMRRTQKFGGWLSSMIMPIIGVIIAWGLLTAFFLKDGWTPVDAINTYVIDNMIRFLIPTLIAFNAGKLVHDNRGGFVATLVVFGVICGNYYNPGFDSNATPSPQFLAAMMVGPLAAAILKAFDKLIAGKIKQGFEMLVNNFSLGILGMIMTVGAFYGMPYVFNGISWALGQAVKFLIGHQLIFLAALIIEPAKILFLNNAINHGVLTPLGIAMVEQQGKSLLFLLEANPGPGLGVLITTMIFDRKLRANAGGASIIQFFGGIHEVYFPFVLMRIEMLFAVIIGGLAGDAVFQIFDVGLRAPASPGSIIALFIQAQSSAINYGGLALGVFVATVTSCGVGSLIFILKRKKYRLQNNDNLQTATNKTVALKGKPSTVLNPNHNPNNLPSLIIFACEAGMGSSAMGAAILRKKLKSANINVNVKNYAIKELPANAQLVITQNQLTNLAQNKVPHAWHKSITNFLDNNFYEQLVQELITMTKIPEVLTKQQTTNHNNDINGSEANHIFQKSNIEINLPAVSKEQAITYSGEKLVQAGYVKPPYIVSMLKREQIISTYMGNFLSIPHGEKDAQNNVISTGIVIHHYREPVNFDGNDVHFIIAIAANNKDHLEILSAIAEKFSNLDDVQTMLQDVSIDKLWAHFTTEVIWK